MTTNNKAFKTKEISATSRASIKYLDSYYTFEATEVRTVNYEQLPTNPDDAEEAVKQEWLALFDTVNANVDNQIVETIEFLKKKK